MMSTSIIDLPSLAPYNLTMTESITTLNSKHNDIPMSFIGLDTNYPTADGQRLRRVHLDGAASPLAASTALKAINSVLPHYSNTHSYVHSSAQISTKALNRAHDIVLQYAGANSNDYAAVFTGAGTTSAINRIARGLSKARPNRKTVLVSSMEHHANDLPHRQFDNNVVHIPLEGDGPHAGAIDLTVFKELCEEHSETVNYVAISSISNVTGIKTPVKQVCEIAHQHGIFVLLDGAQSVAHGATNLSSLDVDFLVFSGHKLYTPMSPGVMIAKRAILKSLSEQDLGGGSVSHVSFHDQQLVDNESDKEESGTPNIVGAIALSSVLNELMSIGFDTIEAHDNGLLNYCLEELRSIEGITVYAKPSAERAGALAFNHQDIDHGLLAAILNDYFSIAVRNECFCAHPYVSSLLKQELWELDLTDIDEQHQEDFINRKRGMVRVSFSLYNTKADIDKLLSAIKQIWSNYGYYANNYSALADGSYQHTTFKLDWESELGLEFTSL